MSANWPFDLPNPPALQPDGLPAEVFGKLTDWLEKALEVAYWSGVGHGVLATVLVEILIAAIIGVIICFVHKKREFALGCLGIVVSLLLWYSQRSSVNPLPHMKPVPVKPTPEPVKPKKPWLPWRSGEVGESVEK